MFREEKFRGRDPDVVVRSKTTFKDPLKWKLPRKVFTCSLSDFFIEEADAWRGEAWAIIKATPHTYQILTKRPENIAARLPKDWGEGYPNVWLVVSTENQDAADLRIPILLEIPAAVRGLSCEPLLEELKVKAWLYGKGYPWMEQPQPMGTREKFDKEHPFWDAKIDWVICGGESGAGYREMNLDWARSLRDQCKAAGVAFWYKQSSGIRSGMNPTLDGKEYHEFPK
jgi:protein gp37